MGAPAPGPQQRGTELRSPLGQHTPEHLETRKIKRDTRLAFGVPGSRCDGFPETRVDADGMARGSSGRYRARRLDRERQRRTQQEQAPSVRARQVLPGGAPAGARAGRAVAVPCGWCGARITPAARGPLPTWCSATCRHRAWEQTRAAASGRSAVKVVERRVEVPVLRTPARREWPAVLRELAAQLDDGRLYDRDLAPLAKALAVVSASLERRIPHLR